MSLDDELRATMGREAELREVPAPDVAGLIRRGQARRRRRNVVRLGVGVVATAVVAASAAGIVAVDPRAGGDVTSSSDRTSSVDAPPSPPPLSVAEDAELAPGTYRMFVGLRQEGEPISADATLVGPHWRGGDFAVVSDEEGGTSAGFGVYQPVALAADTGCDGDRTTSELGQTPSLLARQLAKLPRSTLLQPPARAELFGLDAVHLRLRVDVDCPRYYRLAHAAGGTRGITYNGRVVGTPAVNVVIDFWVLDLGGDPVVVDEWHNVDAPPGLVAQAREARESIAFVMDH